VQVFEGSAASYAEELVDEYYDLPELAARYFDYESFARDLVLGGDICEVGHNLYVVNPNDF